MAISDRGRRSSVLFCACHNPGSGLTGDQLDQLERLLIERLQVLAEETAHLRELQRRLRIPLGEQDAVQAMLAARLAEARNACASAAHALQTIDSPAFGVCVRCQGPIGFVALRAAPSASCCTRCTVDTSQTSSARSSSRPPQNTKGNVS